MRSRRSVSPQRDQTSVEAAQRGGPPETDGIDRPRRHGPTIFLAAHLAGVVAFYAIALVAGEGRAPPPFPPDTPRPAATRPVTRAAAVSPAPRPSTFDPKDPAPAWWFDAEGHLHMRER